MSDVKKVKIGDVCTVTKGVTGIQKAIVGRYPMVTLAEERRTHNEFQFDCKAVIVPLVSSTGHGHASMKRVHYEEGKFALGSILCAVVPNDSNFLNPKYLHIYLSYLKDKLLVPLMKGAANVSLSISNIKTVEVVVPPIKRQLEIIELEKLLFCQNQKLFEQSVLQKSHIALLRQQILQDAISGKLTEDWRAEHPDSESASELLKRIKTEKEKLIASKKMKKEKPLPPILENEILFDLPSSWEWCRLGETGIAKIGLTYKPSDVVNNGIPVLRSNNIQNGTINYDNLIKVKSCSNEDKMSQVGDILICARNGSKHLVGKAALITKDGMSFGAFMSLFRTKLSYYVYYFLQSDAFRSQFDDEKSTGINQLTQGILRNIAIPLPSLAEQIEIVKRIEKLMGYVSQLEEQVAKNKQSTDMLMQAFLAQSFTN